MSEDNGGLSKEEFLRLQEQLIELRQNNYELQAQLKKKNADGNVKEAFQFASKLINRSKDKETTEIDQLRVRLVTQEEEFRLQQQTFIQELNKVVQQNEELERKLQNPNSTVYTSSQSEQLLHEIENLKSRENSLTEEIEEHKRRSNVVAETLNEKEVLLAALENQLLDMRNQMDSAECSVTEVRSENETLRRKMDEKCSEIQRLHEQIQNLEAEAIKHNDLLMKLTTANNNLQSSCNELRANIATLNALKQKLEANILEDQSSLSSKNKELQEVSAELSAIQKRFSNSQGEIEQLSQSLREKNSELLKCRSEFEEELLKLREQHQVQLNTMSLKMESMEEGESKKLEERLLLLESKYKLEISDIQRAHCEEKSALEKEIANLRDQLEYKDEQRMLALKKQNALVKELQKAVKEERKRAESLEKSREREGWHVVEPDAQSSHIMDGTESVSSLSALESDNVELISRLTSLQKMYAEAQDQNTSLDRENEVLRREISEKNELIEHWIRSRPLPNNSPQNQKSDGVLKKFLNVRLNVGEDSSTNDVREMNKKLQRMLEECLSKNIILQRDIQTLLERTEM